MDKDDLKEKLFGRVQPLKRKGGGFTDDDWMTITSPLEPDCVLVYCKAHTPMYPILELGAREVVSTGGVDSTSDWTGKYIEVSSCPLCGDGFSQPHVCDMPKRM